jgi:hypothetical protein
MPRAHYVTDPLPLVAERQRFGRIDPQPEMKIVPVVLWGG